MGSIAYSDFLFGLLLGELRRCRDKTYPCHALALSGACNATCDTPSGVVLRDCCLWCIAAVEENALSYSMTIAVWADHGDYAGDYGLVEKWPSGLEDVLTRVPLLVRTPGGKMGQVVKTPVQLFDIVPTVLELAGINLTHIQFGVSQVKQLHGAAGDATRAVFAEVSSRAICRCASDVWVSSDGLRVIRAVTQRTSRVISRATTRTLT